MLSDYVAGADQPGDAVWAIEGHLETCAQCRARLAGASTVEVSGLLAEVWAGVEPQLGAPPLPKRSRVAAWLHGWATPVMMPWLAMVVVVGAVSVWLDSAFRDSGLSYVQLLAPVLPVFGVAAAWSRGLDPSYELTAGTPRAGLELVLRRTTAVVVPGVAVLLSAGWLSGAHLGFGLLPSLAFTLGTLALGTFIGVAWAASILIGLWLGALVVPSLTLGGSALLAPSAWPVWLGIVLVAGAFVVLRRNTFTQIAHH
jgi:hypothetical protein